MWICGSWIGGLPGGEGCGRIEDLFEHTLRIHPDGAVVEFSSEGRLEEVLQLQCSDSSYEFEMWY